jgi:hypothetical protein
VLGGQSAIGPMPIDADTLRSVIRDNVCTAVVCSKAGDIQVIPFSAQPTPEAVLKLAEGQGHGSAFRLIPQGELSQGEVDQLLAGLAGAQAYADTHDLRPGVNIPRTDLAVVRRLRPAWLARMSLSTRVLMLYGVALLQGAHLALLYADWFGGHRVLHAGLATVGIGVVGILLVHTSDPRAR